MLYASGRQLGASARITLALTLSANARNVNYRALADAAQGLAGSMDGGHGPAALQRLIRHRLAAAPGL